MRAWMTIVQRDLQVQAIIGDVYAGRPVVYRPSRATTRSRTTRNRRRETLDVLRRLDRQFARIELVTLDAPRPYELVVLSDHGQSQGATFKQRYDQTLEELVRSACGTEAVESSAQGTEGFSYLSAAATERDPVSWRRARAATRKKHVTRAVVLGEEERERQDTKPRELPEIVVMARAASARVLPSANRAG